MYAENTNNNVPAKNELAEKGPRILSITKLVSRGKVLVRGERIRRAWGRKYEGNSSTFLHGEFRNRNCK